jgi:hypothetical protein
LQNDKQKMPGNLPIKLMLIRKPWFRNECKHFYFFSVKFSDRRTDVFR